MYLEYSWTSLIFKLRYTFCSHLLKNNAAKVTLLIFTRHFSVLIRPSFVVKEHIFILQWRVVSRHLQNFTDYLYLFYRKNKMNAEDPDFEEASSIGDRASFVSNTSSTRLLRSTCQQVEFPHGIQFNSRISPSPSR